MGMQATSLPTGVAVPADGGFAGLLAELSDTTNTKRQESADVLSLLAGLIPAAALQSMQATQATGEAAATDAQSAIANALATGTLDDQTKQMINDLLAQLNAQAGAQTAPAGAVDAAATIAALLDEILATGQNGEEPLNQTVAQGGEKADGLPLETALAPAATTTATLPQAGETVATATAAAQPLHQLQQVLAQAHTLWQAKGDAAPVALTTLANAVDDALTQQAEGEADPEALLTPTIAADDALAQPDEGGAALADGQQAGKQASAFASPSAATTGFLPTLTFATQTQTQTIAKTETAAPAQTTEAATGAQVYDQLVDRIQTMRTDGQEQMVIQLKPESLGRLTIRLTMSEGGLVAQLAAANPKVQESLAAQAATLANTLSEQGLKDVRVVVTSTAVAEAGIDQQLSGQNRNGQGQGSRRGWAGLESDPAGTQVAPVFQAYEEAGRPGTVDRLA